MLTYISSMKIRYLKLEVITLYLIYTIIVKIKRIILKVNIKYNQKSIIEDFIFQHTPSLPIYRFRQTNTNINNHNYHLDVNL